MTYVTPKLSVLGDAISVIQNVHDKSAAEIDDSPLTGEQTQAAYDLDE